ncbi:MAG: M48 family metallopeptidase [Micavibrio sp.]
MAAIGLKTHIWNNNLRSLALLAAYPLVLLAMLWAIGAVLGGGSGAVDPVAFGNDIVFEYWPVVVTIVAIWFTVAWFFQTRMIRMVAHSRPVTRDEEPELYNLLENLCISRGITIPRLEIIESHARNAFASGVSDNTYAITVTRGLLSALKPDEVEAVLGHELTHIINRDVRLLMVCVIFTGMIGFAAQLLWSNLRYGAFFPRGSGNNRRGNNFMLYFAILAILLVGYLASLLARFALSRSREYMADAGSIELTRNPEAMMRALLRISGRDRIPQATDDIALMCIENSVPFMGLFATHPPIDRRVRMISETTGTPVPALAHHAPALPPDRFQKPGDRAPDWPNRTGTRRNPWV